MGTVVNIENRIYIRGEFRESLCMNFLSLFQPIFPRLSISISNFVKLFNKLYNELEVNKKHHLIYSYNGKSSFVKWKA